MFIIGRCRKNQIRKTVVDLAHIILSSPSMSIPRSTLCLNKIVGFGSTLRGRKSGVVFSHLLISFQLLLFFKLSTKMLENLPF